MWCFDRFLVVITGHFNYFDFSYYTFDTPIKTFGTLLFSKSHKVQAGPKRGLIKYFRSATPSVSDGEQ